MQRKACLIAEQIASLTPTSLDVFQRHLVIRSCFITSKIGFTAPHPPLIQDGKKLCVIKSIIRGAWDSFCEVHPDMSDVHKNLSLLPFWPLAN